MRYETDPQEAETFPDQESGQTAVVTPAGAPGQRSPFHDSFASPETEIDTDGRDEAGDPDAVSGTDSPIDDRRDFADASPETVDTHDGPDSADLTTNADDDEDDPETADLSTDADDRSNSPDLTNADADADADDPETPDLTTNADGADSANIGRDADAAIDDGAAHADLPDPTDDSGAGIDHDGGRSADDRPGILGTDTLAGDADTPSGSAVAEEDRLAAEHPTAIDEPAPAPTAFGASTVGGAVAASAVAGSFREEERADESGDRLMPSAEEESAEVSDVEESTVTPTAGDQGADVPTTEEPTATEDGAEETATPENTELMPGEVSVGALGALWADSTVEGFRARWREVQLRFVDDPESAAGEAQTLVGDVCDTLTSTLADQRAELDGWRSATTGDTEQLRVAVRRYRNLLDRLLGL